MKRFNCGLFVPFLLLTPSVFAATCGDITGDNKLGIGDATLALQIAVGSQTATSAQLLVGDLNHDNKISVPDVTLLLQGVIGLKILDGLCGGGGGASVSTIVGDPVAMGNGSLTDARFQKPASIAVDSQGDLLIADLNNHAIRKITPAGVVSTIAGTGVAGYQDGPVATALLGDLWGVEPGPDGAIYISDASNARIRKISPDLSTVSTLAGHPDLDENGFAKEGHKDGPGDQAQFAYPVGLAVDKDSNVYVADADDYTVRKVTKDGVVSTVAGNEQFDYNDGAGDPLKASFRIVAGVALAPNGDLYMSDLYNELIRVLTVGGQFVDFAGNPKVDSTQFPLPGWEDGPGNAAQFGSPRGITFLGDKLIVADSDTYDPGDGSTPYSGSRVRVVDAQANVTTLAGSDVIGHTDGKGTAATFRGPYDVAATPDGTVYVADTFNDLIRKIAPDGTTTTLAGRQAIGYLDGKANEALLDGPMYLATDGKGTIIFPDYYNNRIRKYTPDGNVTTITGQQPVDGQGALQDGPTAAAQLYGPSSIALAADGTIYFTDRENHAVRKIDPQGNVVTIAGTGVAGYKDGAGKDAQFNRPRYVTIGPDNNLYVADTYNNCIRKITPDGTVSTYAGKSSTTEGYTEGTALTAQFAFPQSIAIAKDMTMYVADIDNMVIRKIDPQGNVTTLAGSPNPDSTNVNQGGYKDAVGKDALFYLPTGIVILSDGSLLVTDRGNSRIRKITQDGTVTTVAGIFDTGFWDGPVAVARFDYPFGIVQDSDGSFLISEENNNRIRRLRL